ncbi:annulin-like [Arctopsyche grandis]|uniref:annulin-like n=1 Tax=Arctopsyche grandis TaxID=121162 RepID=UPI00406D74F5
MSETLNSFWHNVLRRNRVHRRSIENTPRVENALSDVMQPQLLTVESVDYCVAKNGYEHRTQRYDVMLRKENTCLVIRRNQEFTIGITFNRPCSLEYDAVSFILTVKGVKVPSHGQGTLVAIPLLRTTDINATTWTACVEKQRENHMIVKVKSNSTSVVGKWKLQIDTKLNIGGSATYLHPMPFYLLFNPWSDFDDVYIEEHSSRQEYILADSGFICGGVYDAIEKIPWQYSQYEKDILDCSLYLITEVGKLRGKFRGDPIHTVRAISSVINNIVMVGKWDGIYTGGTPPYQWMSSMDILQAYYKTKKPIKYGQCYVFAAVQTTICRAIGIPCRAVTVYESARDTGGSLTIDNYVNMSGEAVKFDDMANSIWSFHVWNEVWMQRPDLGAKYSGWQVIDASPQEGLNDTNHRCGPASVIAVKRGEVQKCHDNLTVYSEINAEKLNWKYSGVKIPMKLLNVEYTNIGIKMATKTPDRWLFDDITENYKLFRRPAEVRSNLIKAICTAKSGFVRYKLNEECQNLKFEFLPRDEFKFGKSFSVVLFVLNQSVTADYMVVGNLKVDTCLYNGKSISTIKRMEFHRVVDARGNIEIKLDIAVPLYYELADSHRVFKMTCLAYVVGSKFEWYGEKSFVIKKPEISMNIMKSPHHSTSREVEVTLDLKNPLPITLKNCVYHVLGCGLKKHLRIKLKKNVEPGGYATTTFKLEPPFPGSHTLTAKFSSKGLNGVNGSLSFSLS